MALSEEHKRFCEEYIKDRNASAAYQRAGYKATGDSARTSAWQLLQRRDIQTEIERLRFPIVERAELDAGAVLREVGRLAFADPRKLYNPDGSLKPLDEWDPDAAACVASIETEEIWAGRGEDRRQIGVTRRVKLWDKTKALALAMDHLGLTQKPTLDAILIFLPVDVAAAVRASIACGVPGPAAIRDVPGGGGEAESETAGD